MTAQHSSPRHRTHRLIRSRDVHQELHGGGALGRLNAAVAVKVTRVVGTMYCAYAFAALAFVALPAALAQGSPTVLINWLSSNFLQLVLLPIIIVGQNVSAAAQDARAAADHETLSAIHELSLEQVRLLRGGQRDGGA